MYKEGTGVRCGLPHGPSHHMFSAGEEQMGVIRNAKQMRPSSASSDQNGVFV